MKFCPNCGAVLEAGVKFCTECGEKIALPAPTPEPPVIAPPVYEPPTPSVYTPEAAEPPKPPVYTLEAAEPPKSPVYTPQKPEPAAKQPREKKPRTKIGLLLAVIAAAIVLLGLLVLLLGGSQGEPEDWGRYEAVSATDEWIELEKKGKATLHILGSEFHGKWNLEDEIFTLDQNGDFYTGTLDDGILRLNLAGTAYVFAKEGIQVEPVTYKAVACISAGQILDEELMDLIGGCYLVLNGDSTGTFWLFGERMAITYTDSSITMEGEILNCSWKGETMVLTFPDGSSFDLVVTEEDPADAAVSEDFRETEEWEESEMEAELLTYLQWPGKAFSDMDLQDGVLTLQGAWGETTVWFKPGTNGGSVVESMHFFVDDADYDDLRELLIRTYGTPTDEGEEPYAESNGGAVLYCWFDHPAGTLRLSAASEYEFTEIWMQTN